MNSLTTPLREPFHALILACWREGFLAQVRLTFAFEAFLTPALSPFPLLVHSLGVQIHYNNPSLVNGVMDRSGVRLYYTEELRAMDAGLLQIGDPLVALGDPTYGLTMLPDGKSMYSFLCPSSCSDQHFKVSCVMNLSDHKFFCGCIFEVARSQVNLCCEYFGAFLIYARLTHPSSSLFHRVVCPVIHQRNGGEPSKDMLVKRGVLNCLSGSNLFLFSILYLPTSAPTAE